MRRSFAASAAFLAALAGFDGAGAADGVSDGLAANAVYTVELYGAAFRQSYPDATRKIDDTAAESWNRFTAESKTGLGRDATFDFKAFGVMSTQEDESRGTLSEPGFRSARPRFIDLIEAKIRWSGEGLDALAGKMLHNVGISIYSRPETASTTRIRRIPCIRSKWACGQHGRTCLSATIRWPSP